jgi:peptidyl-prolyl cis-trans isomerase SurA
MKKNNIKIMMLLVSLTVSCFLPFSTNSKAADKVVTQIIVLVNDTPITFRDFSERAKFNQFNSPKLTKEEIQDITMRELVNETLMLEIAKKNGIKIQYDDVKSILTKRISNTYKNYEAFKETLANNKIDIKTIEKQLEANLSWNRYINSKYRRLINVTLDNIEDFNESATNNSTYSIKKIVLNKTKTKTISMLLEEATLINFKFKDCEENLAELEEKEYINIIEVNNIKLSELQEPTKSMIKFGRENAILPPNITQKNIELIAICSINNNVQNNDAKDALTSRKLENFANKLMRDLLNDAIVEYKING